MSPEEIENTIKLGILYIIWTRWEILWDRKNKHKRLWYWFLLVPPKDIVRWFLKGWCYSLWWYLSIIVSVIHPGRSPGLLPCMSTRNIDSYASKVPCVNKVSWYMGRQKFQLMWQEVSALFFSLPFLGQVICSEMNGLCCPEACWIFHSVAIDYFCKTDSFETFYWSVYRIHFRAYFVTGMLSTRDSCGPHW